MLFDENLYKQKLTSIVEGFKEDLKSIKTGRASLDLFNKVSVEAYGQSMALNAVAKIQIINATRVDIEVWDGSVVAKVEEALREANIGGISSGSAKNVFIINLSPLTLEDREKKVKEIAKWLEERKIRLRQERGEFTQMVEALEKVSEDEQKRSKEKIQETLKEFEQKLEEVYKAKVQEVLSMDGK